MKYNSFEELLSYKKKSEKNYEGLHISELLKLPTFSGVYNLSFKDVKFDYLNIDVDSPGKIGQWLGLQIVNAYQKNERKSIDELLKTPIRELFEDSKYKPRRK